jgi:hypothetical protein
MHTHTITHISDAHTHRHTHRLTHTFGCKCRQCPLFFQLEALNLIPQTGIQMFVTLNTASPERESGCVCVRERECLCERKECVYVCACACVCVVCV